MPTYVHVCVILHMFIQSFFAYQMLHLVAHDDESQTQFSLHVNYITLAAFHLIDQTLLLAFVTLS